MITGYAVNEADSETPEQILWRAVVSTALEDWVSGSLRRRREAEHFLLYDTDDFSLVCESAGINPVQLRERLERLRSSGAVARLSDNLGSEPRACAVPEDRQRQ